MQKLFILGLTIVMAIALSGCWQAEEPAIEEVTVEETAVEEVVVEEVVAEEAVVEVVVEGEAEVTEEATE